MTTATRECETFVAFPTLFVRNMTATAYSLSMFSTTTAETVRGDRGHHIMSATALGALNKSTGCVPAERPKSVCLDKYNLEYIVQQEQPHGVMGVPVTAGRRTCWKFRPFTLGCYVFRGEDGPRAMGLGSQGGRGASRGTQCARRRPHGGLPRRTLFRTAHRCGVLINLGSCVTEPRRSGSQSDRWRL